MIYSVFNQLFVKILIELNLLRLGQKNSLRKLFPETGGVKIFLSLTRLHSRMCIKIYVFNFKKQTNKPKKQKQNKNTKKAKETKEEKRISPENRLKKLNLRPPE